MSNFKHFKQFLLSLFLFATFALFVGAFSVPTQAQTLKDLNPLGQSGIKCLYYQEGASASINQDCGSKDQGLLNKVEELLFLVAPALAVISLMIGGYKYMQEGYTEKASGLKYIQGAVVGLAVVYSSYFVRNLVFQIVVGTVGTSNTAGVTAINGNNAGVSIIITILNILVYNLLIPVAVPVAVFFLILGGYKLLTAGGNPGAIGKALKTIQNALIGLGIILFSIGIISLAQNLIREFLKSTGV
jgi:Type IV secretion system pilin